MSTPHAARSGGKRPRCASSLAPAGGHRQAASAERPSKRAHADSHHPTATTTQGGEDEEQDEVWATMYEALPGALQPSVDHTQGALAVGRGLAAPSAAPAASPSAAAAAAPSTPGFIPSLISSLVPASQFVGVFQSKLHDKHLVLDNSSSTAGRSGAAATLNVGEAREKAERRRRKKRGIQIMSSNQRKEMGLMKIPKQDLKYSMFLPLHQLWVAYIHDILDPLNSRGLSTGERILKADYHGAIFTVVRCRSPTHVGQRGIMILETQETFQIVTERNSLKVLPKRHTVFAITVPPINPAAATASDVPADSSAASSAAATPPAAHVFELYGDHLCFRSYERSARKFKAKATIEL